MQPLHRANASPEPGTPFIPDHSVSTSTFLQDTIVAVATSIFCLFTAEVMERDSPVAARVLRSLPVIITIVWLSRRFLGGSSGSSVHIHHIHANYPQAQPRSWFYFPFFRGGRTMNTGIQPRYNNVGAREPVVFVPGQQQQQQQQHSRSQDRVRDLSHAALHPDSRFNNVEARHPVQFVPASEMPQGAHQRAAQASHAVLGSNPQMLVQPPSSGVRDMSQRFVSGHAPASSSLLAPAVPFIPSAGLQQSYNSAPNALSLNPVAARLSAPTIAAVQPPVSSAAAYFPAASSGASAAHSNFNRVPPRTSVLPPAVPSVPSAAVSQPGPLHSVHSRVQSYAPQVPSVPSAAANSLARHSTGAGSSTGSTNKFNKVGKR